MSELRAEKIHVHATTHQFAIGLISLLIAVDTSAAWKGEITNDIWALPPSALGSRWLVIHNLSIAATEGIYHIEVLERVTGAKAWQKHLADHKAVTETVRAREFLALKHRFYL